MNRYVAVFGFNSKQWWACDELTGEVIDPPMYVLDDIKSHSECFECQEEYFNSVLSNNPDWLNDSEYRYNYTDI